MKHSQSQYKKPSKPLLKKLLLPVAAVCAIFLAAEGFDLYEDYAQYRMETDPAFAQHHDRALSILITEATKSTIPTPTSIGQDPFWNLRPTKAAWNTKS